MSVSFSSPEPHPLTPPSHLSCSCLSLAVLTISSHTHTNTRSPLLLLLITCGNQPGLWHGLRAPPLSVLLIYVAGYSNRTEHTGIYTHIHSSSSNTHTHSNRMIKQYSFTPATSRPRVIGPYSAHHHCEWKPCCMAQTGNRWLSNSDMLMCLTEVGNTIYIIQSTETYISRYTYIEI